MPPIPPFRGTSIPTIDYPVGSDLSLLNVGTFHENLNATINWDDVTEVSAASKHLRPFTKSPPTKKRKLPPKQIKVCTKKGTYPYNPMTGGWD